MRTGVSPSASSASRSPRSAAYGFGVVMPRMIPDKPNRGNYSARLNLTDLDAEHAAVCRAGDDHRRDPRMRNRDRDAVHGGERQRLEGDDGDACDVPVDVRQHETAGDTAVRPDFDRGGLAKRTRFVPESERHL